MNTIEKKIHPSQFDEVVSGNKTYDLRLNDVEINQGDILKLREWDPINSMYTGREVEKNVGYVTE